MTAPDFTIKHEFLGIQGERTITVQYWPQCKPRAHIVYLPPFGEEMNRCRSLVATQARNFARMGFSCMLLDYFGTGDSDGELQDASFEIWRGNIAAAISHLTQESDAPVILWGLRLGALVALEFASRSDIEIDTLLLWQPVQSGKRYITQLLRQRVASLVGKDVSPETTKEIRQRIASGHNVEISGYTIGEDLVGDIESTDLSAFCRRPARRVIWMEHGEDTDDAIGTASQKIVDALTVQGCELESHVFSDPPIWQLHKRDHAPFLLELTQRALTI